MGRLLYGLAYVLSLLPLWLHYLLSRLLWVVMYYVVGYRREVVRRNLQNSFPERSLEELRGIEREFYGWFCDYIVETLKLLTMRREEVMRRCRMEGVEDVLRSLEDHDMVFLYLGHYCNWEYVASLQWWVGEGVRCGQLYSPLHDEAFDYLFYRIRSRYGGDNIDKRHALRQILEYRRRGQKAIVGFISDQAPRWENIHLWTEFLNQDTPFFTGTERIARKVNAAVYYAEMTRDRRGYYTCRMRLMSDDVGSLGEHELSRRYVELLEASIREAPAYWLWSHNRWKRKRSDALGRNDK